MCKYCFDYEIDSFVDEQEFNEFYNILNGKKENLKFVKHTEGYFTKPRFQIFGLGFGSKTIHDYKSYKCQSCGTVWKLSIPEFAWRGYFIKANSSNENL